MALTLEENATRYPRTKGSRSGKMIPCGSCGNEFYVPPSQLPGGSLPERKYCSHKCMSDGHRYSQWDALDKFWSRVDRSGDCWLYTAARDKWGYGDVNFLGKHVQAHRLAWRLLCGEPGKMHVLHKCNTPPCCNPDHLYLGTDLENARDRVAAGTQTVGNWKLEPDDVREIRRLCAAKVPQRVIAERYGLNRAYVSAIKCGRYWEKVK